MYSFFMGRSGGLKKNSSNHAVQSRTRLKASDSVVAEFKTAIKQIDSEALRDRYRSGNFPNNHPDQDIDMRYRWDLARAALGDKRIHEITQKENLKDDHIDSVLKQLVPPLSETVDLKDGPDHLKDFGPIGRIKVRPNILDPNDPRLNYDGNGAYIFLDDALDDIQPNGIGQGSQAQKPYKEEVPAPVSSLDRFSEGSPGRQKTLSKLIRRDGVVRTRAENIESLLDEGYELSGDVGDRRLTDPSGDVFFMEADSTKAEFDYAQFLIEEKGKGHICEKCGDKKYDGPDMLCSSCRLQKKRGLYEHRRSASTTNADKKQAVLDEMTDELEAENKLLEEFGL